jgi:cob(I)alamin adenosyltransferase
MPERGLIQVYTGKGKGKTSAALGQALRAAGQGQKVCIIQFLKGPVGTGERAALKDNPLIEMESFGG